MSVLTPGFQPFGLSARVEIYDYSNVLQFTYESEQVKAIRPIAALDLNSRTLDLMGTNKGTWTGTEQYNTGINQEKNGDFNGSSRVELLNESNFDREHTQVFSIAIRVDKLAAVSASHVFVAKASSLTTVGLSIFTTAAGLVTARLHDGTTAFDVTSTTEVDDNLPHEILFTFSGNSNQNGMKIYIDSVLEGTGGASAISSTILNNLALTIGAEQGGGSEITARLEQFKFWNFELTSTQAIELFASTSPYGFVTKTTAATRDFNLTDLTVVIDGNGNMGNAILMIEDHANALTDTTKRKRSKIQRQWDIQIFLGKDAGTMQRWFYGKTLDTSVLRPGTAQQHLAMPCVGWGIVIKDRITKITRNQDKLSNGIDLDNTDTKTRLDNLILDLFNKVEHQIDENLPKITSMSIITADTGLCADCLDIKVANVNESGNTYAGFISRLMGVAKTDWYIDKDRQLVVRDPDSHASGFLFTNNLSGIDAQNWDKNKLAYLKNELVGWDDSSFDTMYSWIHGFGHFLPVLDISEETASNSSDNLDDEFIAIPITPTRDNIFKIAVKMNRTGTPPSPLEIQIRGDNAGNPDPADIRRTIKISKEFLATLGTTTPSSFIEFPVKPKLEIVPNEQLYIVFPKYGDVSNTVNIELTTGSGTYKVSTDDITWTTPTGKVSFRVWSAKRLFTSLENTILSQKLPEPREKILSIRADLEEQSVREAMLAASEILGKERRVYEKVKIWAPTSPIPLASFCQIQDLKTGLDVEARVLSYKIELHGTDETRIGANQIELTLDEVHSV